MPMDFSELEDWRDKIEAATGHSLDNMLKIFARQEVLRTIKLIRSKTPVDTGQLRRSWALGSLTQSGTMTKATIVNPIHYASFVEHGTRRYRGAHMAEISVRVVETQIPKRLRAQLKKMLEETKP